MTTHVFIVDEQTFPVHLNYLFAGTGYKDHNVDFNNSAGSRLHHSQERNLVGMMADAGRLRSGDNVVFYLQASGSSEGLFFGVFRVSGAGSFLDRNDGSNYLADELGKPLTYRTALAPGEHVYAEGVTEWEALDEIKNIHAPYQMLWSLIYRKLKGNRGNTMITSYEAERLVQLIRNKNRRKGLPDVKQELTFDQSNRRIEVSARKRRTYRGRQESLNILPRLCKLDTLGRAFEVHLQTYITSNLGLATNPSLDAALLLGARMTWLGNEVSCGVGMQRIDVMPVVETAGQRTVVPVELKAGFADASVVRQVKRYVEWVEQYFVPNCQADIQPVVVAKKPQKADLTMVAAFRRFNSEFDTRCLPIRYVEFEVLDGSLDFKPVSY